MKIFIDPQVFWWQRFGGVSRYFAELLAHYESDTDVSAHFPIRSHDNAYLKEKGLYPNSPFFDFAQSLSFKGSNRLRWYLFRQREKVIRSMQREQYDLYVPTFFDPYFLEYKKDVPMVLTVHDMTHEVSPGSFPQDVDFVDNKKRLMHAADRIIAVSHSTKADIVHFYPELEERVSVVHHGHSLDPSLVQEVDVPKEYILYVGKRWLYKNFEFLLHAFSKIASQQPELQLVCAGGEPFESEEIALIEQLGLSGRVVRISINDRSLSFIYSHALCFVFPSLNEGFGFPILEAMSCRCPVVLPKLSCFPEVAGDAALYYDDESSLIEQITAITTGAVDVEALRKRGLEQAATFSWERCAQETKAVYSSVI
ncbi:glycosyltransferase family 4 protein [Coraliomargarita sp. W4R53]